MSSTDIRRDPVVDLHARVLQWISQLPLIYKLGRQMKIGVMLPNWIGDVVMATPTLRALHKRYAGEAELIGIMKPYVGKVLAGTPWLDHIEWFDRKSKDRDLRTWGLIKRLRSHKTDSMILLTNSLRAGTIAWASGAKQRIGYARYGRGPLLTHGLEPPRENGKLSPISAIEYYLQLAYAADCLNEPPRMELATSEADEKVVDQIWGNLGLGNAKRVVVFNTGGAYGAAKHWPTENYVDLARQIVAEFHDVCVLVICGPAEKETASWIESEVGHPRVVSMAKQDLSLGVAKASVKRAQLMVTTDSGPRHFAPAFNVPVISLFGPIDPRWSDSLHPLAINLSHKVPCGPCGKRSCPLGHHDCMRGLTVDRVMQAVNRQFDRADKRRAA